MDNLLENAILELYFEDNEDIKIYKESMDELIKEESEEYLLNESKLTKEEKEARKKKKLEERIQKAKERMVLRIENILLENVGGPYGKFELDCHVATPKERALFIARFAMSGGTTIGGLYTADRVVELAVKGFYKNPNLIGKIASTGLSAGVNIAAASILCGSVALIMELINQQMYKEIYAIKIYATHKKTKKRKLLRMYISVKVTVNDLHKYKNWIKQI